MDHATADGDVGRLWEVIKVMVFTFAGSSHSNYTKYLLEMITNLELECTPELRRALLQISLVNLTGRDGHWSAGDFIQEYFNRLLEAIVHQKGVEYGDKFIRQVWSRNIHHVARLKISWFDGVGLERRSARHKGAGDQAEMRILLKAYQETELHSFRGGRSLTSEVFVDQFQKGVRNLEDGKLQKWITKTTQSRGLQHTRAPDDNIDDGHDHDLDYGSDTGSDVFERPPIIPLMDRARQEELEQLLLDNDLDSDTDSDRSERAGEDRELESD